MTRAAAIGLGVVIVAVLALAQAQDRPDPEPPRAASILDRLDPLMVPSSVVGSVLEGPTTSAGSSALATACGTWSLAVGGAEQSAVRLMHATGGTEGDERALAVSLTTLRVAARAAGWTPALAPPDALVFRSAESAADRALREVGGAPRADDRSLVDLMAAIGSVRERCD